MLPPVLCRRGGVEARMAAATAALVAASMVSLSTTPFLPPFSGEFAADAAFATTSEAAFLAAFIAAALASNAGCDDTDTGGGVEAVLLEEGTCVGTAVSLATVLAVVGAAEDVATLVAGAALSGCPSTFCFFDGGPDVTDEDTAGAVTAEAAGFLPKLDLFQIYAVVLE